VIRVFVFPLQLLQSAPSYAATIDALLLDVRLAILLIGESAATNLARLVHCIPTIFDATPIRLRFLNVPWS
jgi:hypothetical protein